MFQRTNVNSDPKSESDRLGPATSGAGHNSSHNERIPLTYNSRQQQHLHHHHHNYFSNNSKEEFKSHRLRNSNFHSLSQNSNQEMDPTNTNNILNQRGSQHMIRSTTNPQLYQIPPLSHQHEQLPHSQTTSTTKPTAYKSEISSAPARQTARPRAFSNSTIMSYPQPKDQPFRVAHNSRQEQLDRGVDEVVTMIKEESDNNLDEFKESELETLGSLERDLPVELSFLIRQQAFCMARMNYLDRQIRELKEARTNPHHQASSTSVKQSNPNRTASNTTTAAHTKNGNFILSDDSGGDYSRATISDDDELSSLLDQIARSLRPERNVNSNVGNSNQPRANYNVLSNQPTQHYAIINPNQLHHQAVPVFVMGSPIAVAHPSSISSNVLPGVHFQPEPRYNQYYEDFYVQNNSSSSTINRQNGLRSHQFDSNISAIELLVSQKEKRQIKSHLKSADNWLKMRSSGLCNLNDNFGTTTNGVAADTTSGSNIERNLPNSSSSATIAREHSEGVTEESRSR